MIRFYTALEAVKLEARITRKKGGEKTSLLTKAIIWAGLLVGCALFVGSFVYLGLALYVGIPVWEAILGFVILQTGVQSMLFFEEAYTRFCAIMVIWKNAMTRNDSWREDTLGPDWKGRFQHA